MPSKYSAEEKQKALAMAKATTIREAAEATGVRPGTIKRWRYERRKERGEEIKSPELEPGPPSKKLEEISREATERAKEDIAVHIAEVGKELAERLLQTTEEARLELLRAIKEGRDDDEANSAWVRAVTGAMNYCIKTKNELAGGTNKGVNVNVTQQTNVPQSPEESRNRLLRRINSVSAAESTGEGDPGSNGGPRS